MSTVQLYTMPESPPCRAVMMVAKIVNAPMKENYLNLSKQEHLKEEFVQLNPLHKVPFIVHDGLKMNESRAIIAYLANRFLPDDNVMYPRDPVKRARVDELIHLDSSLYSAASKILYPIMMGFTNKIDEKGEVALRGYLEYLSNRVAGNGATFTLLEACEYDISEYKPLVEYIERLKNSIPSYEAINNKPTENMKTFFKSKQIGSGETKPTE